MLINYETITEEKIREMYDSHIEFAEYVSAFARLYNITVNEALKQAVVKERAVDYITRY